MPTSNVWSPGFMTSVMGQYRSDEDRYYGLESCVMLPLDSERIFRLRWWVRLSPLW